MTVITIHMLKNDGDPGGSVSLPGVWESGCISGRLPDDPGGFTCMEIDCLMSRGAYRYTV